MENAEIYTKITLVCTDLSENCSNRTLTLARALALHHEVEIVGATFGKGLWPPLQGVDIPLRSVEGEMLPGFWQTQRRLQEMMDGDVILACKPRVSSFGVALLKQRRTGVPVILDVDDDEFSQTEPGRRARLMSRLRNPNGYDTTRWLDRFRHRADAVFCVSELYRARYGGSIVPHGASPAALDPAKVDRQEVRRELGFSDSDVVFGFIGTPRPSKGLDLLAAVLHATEDPRVRLLVVGASPGDAAISRLRERHPALLEVLPMQPLSELPKFVAAADVVAIPQLPVPQSLGQMPAKLTDAMAMGKPVVASALADIPKLLEGCGLVAEPGSFDDLLRQVRWMLDNPGAAADMGRRARERFLKDLTYDRMASIMIPEIDRLLRSRSRLSPPTMPRGGAGTRIGAAPRP